MLEHINDLYGFYGDIAGMRVARKHISWYTKGLAGSASFRHHMNTLDTIPLQQQAINDFFSELKSKHERLVYSENELEALAA
jgi:tRNA-dihydrouridine synthase B